MRLNIIITGFALLFAGNAKAQVGVNVNSCPGWMTYCCVCTSCLTVDPLPAEGYCRHCNLLCGRCREKLGDLTQALEKIRAKNRVWKQLYDDYEAQYGRAREGFNDTFEKIFGSENNGDWNLSGLNSSLGKFFGGALAVLSNKTGASTLHKVAANGIQIYQTSGTLDALTNVGGAVLDVFNTEWMMDQIQNDMTGKALRKFNSDLNRGVPFDKAMADFTKTSDFMGDGVTVKQFSNSLDFMGLALDVYGYYSATNELFDDINNAQDFGQDAAAAQKEMERISDSIIKNVNLIACIKETQDSLKSGPLGYHRMKQESFNFAKTIPDTSWVYDEYKLTSAISQTKELLTLLAGLKKRIREGIIIPLLPWIAGEYKDLKKTVAISLLQRAKKNLETIDPGMPKIKSMSESIVETLKGSVTGFEIDFMQEASINGGPGKIYEPVEKWKTAPGAKIKQGMGRVPYNFPNDIDWRMEFYKGSDYLGSNSSSGSDKFRDMEPGVYDIELNYVRVHDVPVESGMETRVGYGVLKIVNRDRWELYTANKAKYLTSGVKPVKMAMVPGTYVINIRDKDFTVTIKERMTVKLELPNPYLEEDYYP